MSIYSVVIHAKPENLESVVSELMKLKGVDVPLRSDEGKIVVTLDYPDRGYCSDTLMSFHNIPGVLTSALIYEFFEEEKDTNLDFPDLKLTSDACDLDSGTCQT